MELYSSGKAIRLHHAGGIVHRNRSFSKTLSKPEEFEHGGLRFSVERKHFENGTFRKG